MTPEKILKFFLKKEETGLFSGVQKRYQTLHPQNAMDWGMMKFLETLATFSIFKIYETNIL